MKRLLVLVAVSGAVAALVTASGALVGGTAQAARVPHQHASGPIGALHQATLNHHEVALDVGVAYESTGLFAVVEPDEMCPDCGGNHPQLYWVCEKCQNGTLAACWVEGRLVSCRCTCGYLDRCLWIRW